MKRRNVVLVLDADADTARTIASAATTGNLRSAFRADLKRVFPILQGRFRKCRRHRSGNGPGSAWNGDPGGTRRVRKQSADHCRFRTRGTSPRLRRATTWSDRLPGKTSKCYAVGASDRSNVGARSRTAL